MISSRGEEFLPACSTPSAADEEGFAIDIPPQLLFILPWLGFQIFWLMMEPMKAQDISWFLIVFNPAYVVVVFMVGFIQAVTSGTPMARWELTLPAGMILASLLVLWAIRRRYLNYMRREGYPLPR